MEQAIISGVAHDRSEAKITVVGVPDKIGEAARIFEARGRRRDQHRHDRAERLGRRAPAAPTSPSRCRATTAQIAMAALARLQDEVGFEQLLYDDRSARSRWSAPACAPTPGVTARFFAALAAAGVNIEMISTSEIRISVIVDEDTSTRRSPPHTGPSTSTATRSRPSSTAGTGR